MEFFKPWVGTSGVNICYPHISLLVALHGFHVVMSDGVSNMSVHFVCFLTVNQNILTACCTWSCFIF